MQKTALVIIQYGNQIEGTLFTEDMKARDMVLKSMKILNLHYCNSEHYSLFNLSRNMMVHCFEELENHQTLVLMKLPSHRSQNYKGLFKTLLSYSYRKQIMK